MIRTSQKPKSQRRHARQQQQVRQAEELLFAGPQRRSVAKELFWGRLAGDLILPYPRLLGGERPQVAAALRELRRSATSISTRPRSIAGPTSRAR